MNTNSRDFLSSLEESERKWNDHKDDGSHVILPKSLVDTINQRLIRRFPDERIGVHDIYRAQQGKCICARKLESIDDLNIDHDHDNGRVRGLLCRSCNTMLGLARDSTETLSNAIAYLKASRKQVQEEDLIEFTAMPVCPKCEEGRLVQRKRRLDGKPFLGCNRFPKCNFLVNDSEIVG